MSCRTPCGSQYVGEATSTNSEADVSSEFWAPPEVADSVSDEFDGASFNTSKWTLSNVAGWGNLVSAGPVDSTTSPAAGTVRVTQQNSHLYIQPALGLEVAVRQTINLALTPYQFSARIRMPIPLAVAVNADIFSAFNVIGPGLDMTNRAELAWITIGANDLRWFAQVISGGVQFGAIVGNNLDLSPFDAEFRMLITSGFAQMFLFTGGSKHYVLTQSIPNFTQPAAGMTLAVRCRSINAANMNMPAAPIYAIDYIRQLISPNVL